MVIQQSLEQCLVSKTAPDIKTTAEDRCKDNAVLPLRWDRILKLHVNHLPFADAVVAAKKPKSKLHPIKYQSNWIRRSFLSTKTEYAYLRERLQKTLQIKREILKVVIMTFEAGTNINGKAKRNESFEITELNRSGMAWYHARYRWEPKL